MNRCCTHRVLIEKVSTRESFGQNPAANIFFNRLKTLPNLFIVLILVIVLLFNLPLNVVGTLDPRRHHCSTTLKRR